MRGRALAVVSAVTMAAAALGGSAAAVAAPSPALGPKAGVATSYLVLARTGVSASAVATTLRAHGAKVTSVNSDIGLITVTSTDSAFRRDAGRIGGVQGVAADRSIGRLPTQPLPAIESESLATARAGRATAAKTSDPRRERKAKRPTSDPLDSNLWGMKMIKADKAHVVELGDKRVKVGVIDSGIDADHPDLAANFDWKLSRNFVTDIPAIDGPCEHPSCVDPVGEDDNGHGTHVAGTIAAALNGFGVSGVAPDVDLVEVRAGQDSGYFFLGPVVNAITYAADAGIDVINMSFYVDPWQYNCVGGAPQDSPDQAADQNLIIAAMTLALDYAHRKNVTMVAALGNNHDDLANPRVDVTSPDYGAAPFSRTVSNASCVNLPTEGPHVIGVSSLGPSGTKSDFSSWTTDTGSGEIDLSAPGGWFRDGFGTDTYKTNANLILSSYPLAPLQAAGQVDENGDITPLGESTGVIKECQARPRRSTSACGYYAWLQGTSMASPHVAGVAALAISAHGRHVGRRWLGLSPDRVARLLMSSATDHACPAGGVQSYANEGRGPDFTATCVGSPRFNGFYGAGVVNALGVVR